MQDKNIVLGVTGSIAAYKAVSLLRQLQSGGARVTTVMTRAARKFVSPLTFEVLGQGKVYTDLFMPSHEMAHITLAENADLILIAPATANFIAKMSAGLSDDLLSALVLAAKAPVILAPAMDGEMWNHPATRRNVEILEGRGIRFVRPVKGLLASGKTGEGRLAEENEILKEVSSVFQETRDLAGKSVCITAGPTLEPIDPVRFISNRSSGKMGYAVAREAAARGARVCLISGPTSLIPPSGAETVWVQTGEEMAEAVFRAFPGCDILVMAAAVSDFRVRKPSLKKIKKKGNELSLELVPARDILGELGKCRESQILVGFAAETEEGDSYPLEKLKTKNLDLIVANNITLKGAEFGSDTNIVTFFDRFGQKEEFPILSKDQVAKNIFNKISSLTTQR